MNAEEKWKYCAGTCRALPLLWPGHSLQHSPTSVSACARPHQTEKHIGDTWLMWVLNQGGGPSGISSHCPQTSAVLCLPPPRQACSPAVPLRPLHDWSQCPGNSSLQHWPLPATRPSQSSPDLHFLTIPGSPTSLRPGAPLQHNPPCPPGHPGSSPLADLYVLGPLPRLQPSPVQRWPPTIPISFDSSCKLRLGFPTPLLILIRKQFKPHPLWSLLQGHHPKQDPWGFSEAFSRSSATVYNKSVPVEFFLTAPALFLTLTIFSLDYCK